MLSIYNYMAAGVLVTGVVALLFAPYARDVLISESGRGLSGLGWIITLAPLGFRDGAELRHQPARNQHGTDALLGLCRGDGPVPCRRSSSPTPTRRSPSAFFAAAAAFAGLSLFGYTTKRDLSAFGTFLIMGVVGILVAGCSTSGCSRRRLGLAISILGVLIFAA